MGSIHPTAVIAEGARIGAHCEIGPYSVIGAHVEIGSGNTIGSHVVIDGHTRIGDENRIFQFASIGAAPQDKKFHGEPSMLEIGNGNIIREYVTLQPGTAHGTMRTVIGSSNMFMAVCHVGHDCRLGDGNILANSVALAGHVTVGNFVHIGGLAGIHQGARIGDYAFIGAGAMVNRDIPPYCLAQGDRAGLVGINKIGLQRAGFSEEDIRTLVKMYRTLFLQSGKFQDRVDKITADAEGSERAQLFLQFVTSTTSRGITPARRDSAREEGQ